MTLPTSRYHTLYDTPNYFNISTHYRYEEDMTRINFYKDEAFGTFTLKVAIPGVDERQLKVKLAPQYVEVEAVNPKLKDLVKYYSEEISSSYKRKFVFPENITADLDTVEKSLKNGILTITFEELKVDL